MRVVLELSPETIAALRDIARETGREVAIAVVRMLAVTPEQDADAVLGRIDEYFASQFSEAPPSHEPIPIVLVGSEVPAPAAEAAPVSVAGIIPSRADP